MQRKSISYIWTFYACLWTNNHNISFFKKTEKQLIRLLSRQVSKVFEILRIGLYALILFL